MHKFIGYSETGSATYEITFNKSLEHTGRFCGIEDGLNAYVENERKQDFRKSIFKELDDILEDAEHIASLMDNGRSNHSLGESQGFENGAQWVIDAIKARM